MEGVFITFEGGEGAGKSTHIAELTKRLRAMGKQVVQTREPGGTPQAEAVRALLVSGDVNRWSAEAEALLNTAARDSHLRMVIRPALARGEVVLCDRFMDSTRAYQGYAGGCDMGLIDQLEKVVVAETRPRLTLIFDLDPEVGLRRARGRGEAVEDRYERKGINFHSALRQGFLEIARHDPGRCRVIDCAASVETVAAAVWAEVSRIV